MLSIKKQVEYWQEGAEESYKTMMALEKSGRYDDYKKVFYKMCTKEYTAQNLAKIIEIYKMLCQKLKQKKL